jgi:predicted phage-related endonuclease
LRIHRIQRDEEMIARLVELERQFWRFVELDHEPPADGSDSADLALRCLYPQDTGVTLDLTADTEMSSTFSDLCAIRQQLAKHVELEAALKQRIQQRMGDASRAMFGSGEVTWKRSKDGSSLDSARLAKEQPELVRQYTVPKPGSRRFLVGG